jgi:hypothetical protein
VRHRRIGQGITVCVIGAGLALTPLAAASASSKNHKPSRNHSTPTSTVCKDVKAEQSSQSSVGLSIEKAIASGNFATAKQAMLNAYDGDLNNVQKALGVLKQAPANVQAAFKNLLTYVQQIKSDIQNANSEQQLVTSFETLGKDTRLETDGTTIANWVASKCGGSVVTTTTGSLAF